jgi:Ser/Thr protein kinase RdoA (MazF antagonist)
VGDVVRINGRVGLEYGRLDGPSILQVFRERPWRLPAMARLLAELHLDMHSRPAADLPEQRERLQYKIQHAAALPDELRQAALAALYRLPIGERLCHGDFHPDNVLLSGRARL